MNTVIWILGSISSGKTSLNKEMIKFFGDGQRELVEGERDGIPFIYTKYGKGIASLGNINESQCCGLDRVSSKLKNPGIEMSLKEAVKACDIVIVESIMSASTWFPFVKACSANLFLVHLHCTFEENVRRLKRRQAIKNLGKVLTIDAEDFSKIELTDDNYEFIRKTRMQYRGIYEKFKGECHSIDIDTNKMDTIATRRHIVKFMMKKL